MGAVATQYGDESANEQVYVHGEGPAHRIGVVELDHVIERDRASPECLPGAGDTGLDARAGLGQIGPPGGPLPAPAGGDPPCSSLP